MVYRCYASGTFCILYPRILFAFLAAHKLIQLRIHAVLIGQIRKCAAYLELCLLSFLLFLKDSHFNCPRMPVILPVS